MLPNFLCIGAQKSGTTSVSKLLEAHPDVYMPERRETRFFVEDSLYEMGVAQYEMGFFGGWRGQSAVGEKTPEYLLFDDTPSRVRALLGGDIRLIVCLRAPAARAYAHYRQNLMLRVETVPFRAALHDEPARIAGSRARTAYFGYRFRGRYAERLAPWLATFPRDNFLFIKFDELVNPSSAPQVAGRIFDFLGLKHCHVDAMPHEGRAVPPEWIVSKDEITISGTPLLARNPSCALRQFVERSQMLDASPPSSLETQEWTKDWWEEDIMLLGDMTGLHLQDWLA